MKSASSALALSFLASGLAPRLAAAATPSVSFGVTAIVQSACQVSAAAMDFQTYSVAMKKAASTISVTCTHPTPYNVCLSSGLTTCAPGTTWKMTISGSALRSPALVWNFQRIANRDRVVDANSIAWTGNSSNPALYLQRQFSAGQCIATGGCADAVTVIVIY